MLEGQSAVTSYGRGVVLLKKELEAANAEGDKQLQATIRQQIAAAHASVAELYMTDLCFEDNAEVFAFRDFVLAEPGAREACACSCSHCEKMYKTSELMRCLGFVIGFAAASSRNNSQARCEACIKAAMAADPKAPESWQAYTGLRLVQGKFEEARTGAANIVKAFAARKSAVVRSR